MSNDQTGPILLKIAHFQNGDRMECRRILGSWVGLPNLGVVEIIYLEAFQDEDNKPAFNVLGTESWPHFCEDAALLSFEARLASKQPWKQSSFAPMNYLSELHQLLLRMTASNQSPSRLYLVRGPDNSLSLSNVSCEDELYENNHVNIVDHHSPKQTTYDALRNTVTNILHRAGVKFTEE